MSTLEKKKKDLSNLLKYTEELLNFNEKIIFNISSEPYPYFSEHAVSSLEGVDLAPDSETWVRIRRLRETPPPAYPEEFQDWVDGKNFSSPDKEPKLISERILTLTPEKILKMAEAGLVPDPSDIMPSIKSKDENPKKMDVIFRPAKMPRFQQRWQEYIDGPWTKWATLERPRRRSIDFYNKIYQIYQRMQSMGDDTPIELIFGLGIARWKLEQQELNVPLIEQQIEIELREDGSLLVRPRPLRPALILRAFHALEIEGSKNVQKDVGLLFDKNIDDPDVGFSPFDKATFETILRSCAARLSSRGIYYPEVNTDPTSRALPAIDNTLRITDTWVIYVRQRNEDFRKDDIKRLIRNVEKVDEEEKLPPPGVKFVVKPSDKLTVDPNAGYIDLTGATLKLPETTSGWHGGGSGGSYSRDEAASDPDANDYFFPLPYNSDQIEIMRRLEDKNTDGVLVQGPPGTGKTHTIANIICHYLATKRRVLVTAKTPEALTALQEKLPDGIRDLAIAVIHSDREGSRQLEHAVRVLSDEAKTIDPRKVNADISAKQARILKLREAVADIDKQLFRFADRNLARVKYKGQEVLPMQLATKVNEGKTKYDWLEDVLTFEKRFDPQFTENDIDQIRRLRTSISTDLIYRANDIPDVKIFPSLPKILSAHHELTRANAIADRFKSGDVPLISISNDQDVDTAKAAVNWLKEFFELICATSNSIWLLNIYQILIGQKKIDSVAEQSLKSALHDWVRLYEQGRALALKSISVGQFPLDAVLIKTISELAAGKQPFGLFAVFKGGLKAKVDAIRIEGRSPANSDDWSAVEDYVAWQHNVQFFIGRWNSICRLLNAPTLPVEWVAAEAEFFEHGQYIGRFWQTYPEAPAYRDRLAKLFPYGLNIDEAIHDGKCEKLIDALSVNLEKTELAEAHRLKEDLLATIGKADLPLQIAVREIVLSLGLPEVNQTAISESWQAVLSEAARLQQVAQDIRQLDDLVAKVAGSGAPIWAQRLRAQNVDSAKGDLTPTDWVDAWDWARAKGHVNSLGDRETGVKLMVDRQAAENEQKKLFADVVRLRTFLGLKQSLTDKIEFALAKFAAAIARLGMGTGRSAPRQRRIIQEAALETVGAVPCWILPEWRVAEQLPADLAAFHLVIIDEASQSDITALPTIMRGQKVLIVGDDRQVSPTPVGLEDRKIIQLRTTYLSDLPFAEQMDPATSMYELGGMVFPGKAILLQEHFRCVEPIIRFSSRFYPKPLIPLRIPTASERLTPPLIDIYVPYGVKAGDLNRAEADVICAEIAKLVADPAFAKRTIGVISLIGHAQSKLILNKLVSTLGAEVIERHRIICGWSANFQGQERDIIFLSMIACPKSAMAQTSRMFEQRFNVAMSRARDRVVLVRSVASSHLKPKDLKLAVIEHFRNPMEAGNTVQLKDILDLCDSDFERDFGRCFLEMGYRIKPQVPVAGRRIDFVIEGADDKRLAIELDGDQYHGPDRWADDMRRQKSLEQMGWTFWRCWGSSWIADRHGCIDDLRGALERMGIEPIGAAPVDVCYTQHIEVPQPDPALTETTGDDVFASETEKEKTNRFRSKSAYKSVVRSELEDNFEKLAEGAAEIGDFVIIRYNDAKRPLRIRLSESDHRPKDGIVSTQDPLGAAVKGASIDDEIQVLDGGKTRTAVIEKIERMESFSG